MGLYEFIAKFQNNPVKVNGLAPERNWIKTRLLTHPAKGMCPKGSSPCQQR